MADPPRTGRGPGQDDELDDDDGRRSRAIIALGVVLLLAILALFLVRYLKNEGAVEDCLMAHGANCDALTGNR
jgi:hypothetical protein